MTENMKKLLELISQNAELAEKLDAADKQAIIAIAKELGIDLTEADFVQQATELADDELDVVAGGAKCTCVGAGGGKAGGKDTPCGCVVGGAGEYLAGDDGQKIGRCICVMYGEGDSVR